MGGENPYIQQADTRLPTKPVPPSTAIFWPDAEADATTRRGATARRGAVVRARGGATRVATEADAARDIA